MPNTEPTQDDPAVPPQNPSVETGPVGVDVGAVEETVDAAVSVDDAAIVWLDEESKFPQFPKTDWHPVPQWSVVEPQ